MTNQSLKSYTELMGVSEMLSKAVPINRRGMLQESIRSVAKALPAMVGTITGLAELLKKEEKERARPSCFPSRRKDSNSGNTPTTHNEEGKK